MSWIKDIVQNLIKKYQTNNPFEIAEAQNIIVRELPLGNTWGFYMYHSRFKVITLNEKLNEMPYRKYFVCAHELGHANVHPRSNTPFLRENTLFSADKIEIEANTFAVELLIPDDEFLEMAKQGFSVNEIAMIYGVPVEVAHLKKLI